MAGESLIQRLLTGIPPGVATTSDVGLQELPVQAASPARVPQYFDELPDNLEVGEQFELSNGVKAFKARWYLQDGESPVRALLVQAPSANKQQAVAKMLADKGWVPVSYVSADGSQVNMIFMPSADAKKYGARALSGVSDKASVWPLIAATTAGGAAAITGAGPLGIGLATTMGGLAGLFDEKAGKESAAFDLFSTGLYLATRMGPPLTAASQWMSRLQPLVSRIQEATSVLSRVVKTPKFLEKSDAKRYFISFLQSPGIHTFVSGMAARAVTGQDPTNMFSLLGYGLGGAIGEGLHFLARRSIRKTPIGFVAETLKDLQEKGILTRDDDALIAAIEGRPFQAELLERIPEKLINELAHEANIAGSEFAESLQKFREVVNQSPYLRGIPVPARESYLSWAIMAEATDREGKLTPVIDELKRFYEHLKKDPQKPFELSKEAAQALISYGTGRFIYGMYTALNSRMIRAKMEGDDTTANHLAKIMEMYEEALADMGLNLPRKGVDFGSSEWSALHTGLRTAEEQRKALRFARKFFGYQMKNEPELLDLLVGDAPTGTDDTIRVLNKLGLRSKNPGQFVSIVSDVFGQATPQEKQALGNALADFLEGKSKTITVPPSFVKKATKYIQDTIAPGTQLKPNRIAGFIVKEVSRQLAENPKEAYDSLLKPILTIKVPSRPYTGQVLANLANQGKIKFINPDPFDQIASELAQYYNKATELSELLDAVPEDLIKDRLVKQGVNDPDSLLQAAKSLVNKALPSVRALDGIIQQVISGQRQAAAGLNLDPLRHLLNNIAIREVDQALADITLEAAKGNKDIVNRLLAHNVRTHGLAVAPEVSAVGVHSKVFQALRAGVTEYDLDPETFQEVLTRIRQLPMLRKIEADRTDYLNSLIETARALAAETSRPVKTPQMVDLFTALFKKTAGQLADPQVAEDAMKFINSIRSPAVRNALFSANPDSHRKAIVYLLRRGSADEIYNLLKAIDTYHKVNKTPKAPTPAALANAIIEQALYTRIATNLSEPSPGNVLLANLQELSTELRDPEARRFWEQLFYIRDTGTLAPLPLPGTSAAKDAALKNAEDKVKQMVEIVDSLKGGLAPFIPEFAGKIRFKRLIGFMAAGASIGFLLERMPVGAAAASIGVAVESVWDLPFLINAMTKNARLRQLVMHTLNNMTYPNLKAVNDALIVKTTASLGAEQ